ncbi:Uncharacterised protein [Helicobacter acinonychis]|uniref:Uncharacterized protein n=1 Tax=Helicobacter acinonychis (strain Sheeba) TaxID=382638 RepID=Q17WW8_HELAH|nr:hypothetical protein [Helicobacter acinonychis]CAJ99858.1 conserved hypothetical protein fragment 1 [Helicobacter acinonychis str. Sheeba]STP04407.1 Uncharacterised protein [Helicobacter acinonychis]
MLERSHSVSDFTQKLKLSVRSAKFSNRTLELIEELTTSAKQASEQIKEKVIRYQKALQELEKMDESLLSEEQQQVLKVFKGELDKTKIKGMDLNDLYSLEQGTKKARS